MRKGQRRPAGRLIRIGNHDRQASLLRQYYSHNCAHDVHGAAGEAQVGVVGRIEYEIQPKECDPEAANHRHFYRVITHMDPPMYGSPKPYSNRTAPYTVARRAHLNMNTRKLRNRARRSRSPCASRHEYAKAL